jgi:hypothetical protein
MTDELNDTLREIVARLESCGIAYMLVGSVAALAYGHSRSTRDFDMVIEVRASTLRKFVRSLPDARFYVAEEAAMEALEHETLFNVIDMGTGWKVDLIPRKARPFSEVEFARRTRIHVLGSPMFVASLEDVIVAKLEWAKAGGSERQLEDVRELLRLGAERIDRAHVEHWVDALGLREEWDAANRSNSG